MEKITEFIRLGFPSQLLKRTRTAANLQQVSVNKFIRTAVEKLLEEGQKARLAEAYANDRPIRGNNS